MFWAEGSRECLCGYDVPVNDHTEGKALGPFIMASLEYELLEK